MEIDTFNQRAHFFDTIGHHFDPSVAGGLPDNGRLTFGIHLPDTQNFISSWGGPNGYYHAFGADTNPYHDDDWGTLTLISMIEKVGRSWLTNACFSVNRTRRVGILDLSRRNGGPFRSQANPNIVEHVSHQNGLDVDVRYVRTDGQQAPLRFPDDRSVFDAAATQNLMDCFRRRGAVVRIIVDTVYVKIWYPGITIHDPDHRDHFHVRIRDPDGTEN